MKQFTNSSGRTWDIDPLPPFLMGIIEKSMREEWEKAGKNLPKKPTYEVKSFTGTTQMEHSASTLKTEADKQAWAEYQAVEAAYQNELFNRRLQAAVQCVRFDPSADAAWVSRMKKLGIPLPEDPAELIELYTSSEIIRTWLDAFDLINAVTSAANIIREEVVEAAEDSFRRDLSGEGAEQAGQA